MQRPTVAQQPSPNVVTTSWSAATQISFDDMEKFFRLPIAEASAQLGVCSSTLKRICRDNGIPRWPYRKIMAGKTIEDIRKEAAEDVKSKLAAEQQAASLHQMPNQGDSHYITPSTPSLSQAIPDRKFGSWAGVHSSSQMPLGSSQVHRDHVPLLPGSSALSHKPKVSFPSFLDDLRLGFPSGGLSRASHQWWGSKEGEGMSRVVVSRESENVGKELVTSIDSEPGERSGLNGQEEEVKELVPTSAFARKRKRGALSGRRALRLALSRGYSAHKLVEKDRELVRTVFGEYLPCLWHAAVV